MSWLKIDDGFAEHPKMNGVGDKSFRMHVAALCYCARNLTDGEISARTVRVLAAIVDAPRPKRNVDELVNAGLWRDKADGSYAIHGYLDYNPPGEEVRAKRSDISDKRREAGRKGANARWQTMANGMANEIANPDSNGDGNLVIAPSRPVVVQDQVLDREVGAETVALHAIRLFGAVREAHKSDQLKALCLSAANHLPPAEFESIREYMLEHRRSIRHDGKYVAKSLKNAKERRVA